MARGAGFSDNGGEKRDAVVFHELFENYGRTTLQLPYAVPLFKRNGDSQGNASGTDYKWDPKDKSGAHPKAIEAEKSGGYHNPSAEPGVASVRDLK